MTVSNLARSDFSTTSPSVPFDQALSIWTRVGLLNFGGPTAQIALMHRIIVSRNGSTSRIFSVR